MSKIITKNELDKVNVTARIMLEFHFHAIVATITACVWDTADDREGMKVSLMLGFFYVLLQG